MSETKPLDASSNPLTDDPQSPPQALATLVREAEGILKSLAERNLENPLIDDLGMPQQQREILLKFNPNFGLDPAVLQLAIANRLEASRVRQEGLDEGVEDWAQSLRDAENAVERASKEECEAYSLYVDSGAPSEIMEFDDDLMLAQRARCLAEARLADLRLKYQTLLNAVPEPVIAHTARRRRAIEASPLGQAVGVAAADVAKARTVIEMYAQRGAWLEEAMSGAWWPYLEAELPFAIIDDYWDGWLIDNVALQVHVDYLRTEVIGELSEILPNLRAELRRAIDPCERVLHEWLRSGQADEEALADLFTREESATPPAQPRPESSDAQSPGGLAT